MPAIDLTQEQLAALETYLDSLDSRTHARGVSYYEDGAVGELQESRRGVGFDAEVLGSHPYLVKLRFKNGKWSGACSCPMVQDCKHCCACALEVIEAATNGETDEEEDEEEDPKEDTAKVIPFAKAGSPPEASAVELFAERLGRKLNAEEKRAAEAVDNLFRWHRTSHAIAQSLLQPITRVRPSWGWNTVQIWPTQPRTPWEMWLFIASYLRKNGLPCVAGLLKATDWSEVDALTAEWERRETVQRWRHWLETTVDRGEAAPMEPTELRVRLTEKGVQLEWRKAGAKDFSAMKVTPYQQLTSAAHQGQLSFEEPSLTIWRTFHTGYDSKPSRQYGEPDTARILNQLLRIPALQERILGPQGAPLARATEALRWRVETAGEQRIDYRFALVLPDGSAPPPALTVIDGNPSLYIAAEVVFAGPPLGRLSPKNDAITIPAEALETSEGLLLLKRLGVEPPPRIAGQVRTVELRPVIRCSVIESTFAKGEWLCVEVHAEDADALRYSEWQREGWTPLTHPEDEPGTLTAYDRSALGAAPPLVDALRLSWEAYSRRWQRSVGKNFPAQFTDWLATVPKGVVVELDPLLDSLRRAPVAASVKLEAEDAGIDWFDLRVALNVADTTLTKKEIQALLEAGGGFVRLGKKGWRRLEFQLSAEDEKELAELGLSARDFSNEPQRLHALQLAGKKGAHRLLPEPQARAIERRAGEIQTRVAPEVPAGLSAELRPYQQAGFHFLAYLSTNRFGGILADDMGLGKTVQSLAWLLWLRAQPDFPDNPSLVVCPKSVTENWQAEATRFAPGLRVRVLPRGASVSALKAARAEADLVVINYAQLRGLEEALCSATWHAVILDEAQYIKNPDSQTAKAAWALRTGHRLALSGTPIENRLLDLWSIMGFAMPGVLGKRAAFGKSFDQRGDPFARVRLAARVRPFVLRRTKKEVAQDLPERSEEDLICELEGEQATLYRAELKRARAALLNVKTSRELDKQRFHILSSLLRLRQICCHPALVSEKAGKADSAKLGALFDLLEPIIAEGHKVLVFSQFVQMLDIIREEIERREWRHFYLTGETEERGTLVNEFQQSEGAAVFLISLRAGGFGLNLTAASYVVLFDPWWNPAVENQAIDRTHRIGQTSHVIAYRLLVKESIEEKIRSLQRSKSAVAQDILGEENFTRALTLDDFRFLLGE